MTSQLFTPFTLRGLTLRNRLMVSPMCQYSSKHGLANDWHLVHLGRFAQGGFGLVMVEATAVSPEGRISYGDMGLWSDEHIAPLKRIVDFIHSQGAAAAIQLAHAGRKASTPLPWRSKFDETETEKAAGGFESWTPVGPSAVPHSPSNPMPTALDAAGIARIQADFVAAARRAERAGFDVIELHGAHGYLISEFLSPVSNKRRDGYGGSRDNRMRFALETAQALRSVWPAAKPMFMRLSSTDGIPGGWGLDDSVVLARALAERGVDLIDCSSGGFAESTIKPGPLYQTAYAETIRREARVPTAAVGLITEAAEAEAIIANGRADLVALGRIALDDPNWPVHARRELDGETDSYDLWPKQAGYAVNGKDKVLGRG